MGVLLHYCWKPLVLMIFLAVSPSVVYGAFASTVEPGRIVEESLTLTGDMRFSGHGLVVARDNIEIDLGGHTLSGPGRGPWIWPSPALSSIGIDVKDRTGVKIKNGVIEDFSSSILIRDSTHILVENVTTRRSHYGIYLHESENNIVRFSRVERNVYGLHIQSSDNNTIVSNEISYQGYSPGGYGIYMFDSKRNTITNNNVRQNENQGLWFSHSKGNMIFKNNIIGNNPNVIDSEGDNLWFNEAEKHGNHWSDYQGSDADADGIGDAPYREGGALDRYPLIQPIQLPPLSTVAPPTTVQPTQASALLVPLTATVVAGIIMVLMFWALTRSRRRGSKGRELKSLGVASRNLILI